MSRAARCALMILFLFHVLIGFAWDHILKVGNPVWGCRGLEAISCVLWSEVCVNISSAPEEIDFSEETGIARRRGKALNWGKVSVLCCEFAVGRDNESNDVGNIISCGSSDIIVAVAHIIPSFRQFLCARHYCEQNMNNLCRGMPNIFKCYFEASPEDAIFIDNRIYVGRPNQFGGNGTDPRPVAIQEGALGYLGLPVSFGGGLAGFLKRPTAYEDGGNRASDSQKSEDRGEPPISLFCSMILALIGVPSFLYGLTKWREPFLSLGFITGTVGLGFCIADWAWLGFPPF